MERNGGVIFRLWLIDVGALWAAMKKREVRQYFLLVCDYLALHPAVRLCVCRQWGNRLCCRLNAAYV